MAIAFTAVGNLVNAFKVENGQKLKHALSSPFHGLVAHGVSTHPAEGLNIVALTIASITAVEGFFETAVAAKNWNIQGRSWLFVSGIGSVVASVWLASSAALGTRLTSGGSQKIATGLLEERKLPTRART
jgi:uncharacterized membrane protein HdeD (DUF308 family)